MKNEESVRSAKAEEECRGPTRCGLDFRLIFAYSVECLHPSSAPSTPAGHEGEE